MVEVAIVGAWGLMLLVALWPTISNGTRLLKRWEVPDPSLEEIEEAVRYLKRRRLLYPFLYMGLGTVVGGEFTSGIVVVVLSGTLLAELLALRPRRHSRREATLTPRGLFDIASKWVLGSYVVGAVAAAGYLGIHERWSQLGLLGLSVLAVTVITWAALARPASGQQRVDMALRTRSVHVSAGLGAAVAGALVGGIPAFVGVLAWIAMANTKPMLTKIRG